jgi:hypothetical protein
MWNVLERHGPVIELFEVEGTRERRVVIGYKMGTTQHFFSAISDLYHFYSLYSARKYVEQFANGVTIICRSFHICLGGPLTKTHMQAYTSTLFLTLGLHRLNIQLSK